MKWKPYPKYKDSGAEWLGDVPEHWTVLPVKRRLEYVTSGARDWGGRYSDDGSVFLRIGNLTREGVDLDLSDLQFVTAPEGADTRRTRVRAGDVVVSITADLGSVAWIPKQVEGGYVSQHLALCRPKGVDSRWLSYAMRSDAGRTQLLLSGYGGTKIQLSLGDVREALAAFPTILEQNWIVTFLDHETAKIDTLIAKQERLIELLQEKRQAFISHAVTKGLNPDAPMKPSGVEWLGDVPAHWKIVRLKNVAGLQSGLTLGKDYGNRELQRRPYLRVANVQDGFLDLTTITEVDVPGGDVGRYELRSGDVLMTEGGDFDKLGRGFVWAGQIPGCLHQNHIFAMRPKAQALNPLFLARLMTSSHGKAYFTSTSQQTTNLASTNSTKILSFPIPLPPYSEQLEIIEALDRDIAVTDRLVQKAETAIALMRERRSALISAAVTGKIDIRDASYA